jgi:hypothetical protein
MKLPRSNYGNCLLQATYALLRGFGDRLVVLKSRSRVWPFHFGVEFNRRGSVTYYSFQTNLRAETYAPWWFMGRWKPLDPDKVAARKRFTLSRRMGLVFVFTLIAVLMPVWCVAWACYQPCFMAWWMREAIQRKRKHGLSST